MYDAVVVGAGPNGLAAAITLARAGRSVLVREARDTAGGGCRSAELTLPGFLHDVCSAIHPMVLASPFLRSVELERRGLQLIHPPAPLAHPFDDGTAAVLERSVAATAATLGGGGGSYRALMDPLVRDTHRLAPALLGPFRLPRHPLPMARFGLLALRSARGLATQRLTGARARAMFGGVAAHSMLRLEQPVSAAFGLALGMFAHEYGWPLVRGGSQQITDALVDCLNSYGGQIVTGSPVHSLDDLPPARALLFDVTPRQLLRIAGDRFPVGYRNELGRYRYGLGVFKMDWALDGPIPWRAPECVRAATVHVGGTFDEIAAGESAAWRGESPERPFVLLVQHTLFDPSRAPAGKHTAWAYCHVPSGSTVDMSERIVAQIERFAPGFRRRIIAQRTASPAQLEAYNANYVGGDINGGVQDLRQLFTRPAIRPVPYSTPARDIFICSSATPPGGGVHGMCGYYAARAALRVLGPRT